MHTVFVVITGVAAIAAALLANANHLGYAALAAVGMVVAAIAANWRAKHDHAKGMVRFRSQVEDVRAGRSRVQRRSSRSWATWRRR